MEQQPASPPPQRPTMGMPATLPVPGNAEFALYLVIVVVFAIIWAVSDRFDASRFVAATTALTAAYFLSRGIAKASRVYEQ
jgi:hypothetical protein